MAVMGSRHREQRTKNKSRSVPLARPCPSPVFSHQQLWKESAIGHGHWFFKTKGQEWCTALQRFSSAALPEEAIDVGGPRKNLTGTSRTSLKGLNREGGGPSPSRIQGRT